MLILAAGLLAGLIHVLTGPDHLAAIAPLAVVRSRGAWRAGVRWGLGHSGGVVAIAGVALAFRGLVIADRISASGERIVGIALVVIGLWGLRKAISRNVHAHVHAHAGRPHLHLHMHEPGTVHPGPGAHRHSHAAFGMGLLHGVAGGSHVLGVLPALALPTFMASVSYVAGFAAGTVAAMGVFALVMGWLSGSVAQRGERTFRGLLGASATATLAVGAFWLIHGPV